MLHTWNGTNGNGFGSIDSSSDTAERPPIEVVINFFEYEEEDMLLNAVGAAAEVVFIKLGFEAEDRSR